MLFKSAMTNLAKEVERKYAQLDSQPEHDRKPLNLSVKLALQTVPVWYEESTSTVDKMRHLGYNYSNGEEGFYSAIPGYCNGQTYVHVLHEVFWFGANEFRLILINAICYKNHKTDY